MLPTVLPNEKHVEATHSVRITVLQFLVDRVVGISKQEKNENNIQRPFILFCCVLVLIIPSPEVWKGFRLFFLW